MWSEILLTDWKSCGCPCIWSFHCKSLWNYMFLSGKTFRLAQGSMPSLHMPRKQANVVRSRKEPVRLFTLFESTGFTCFEKNSLFCSQFSILFSWNSYFLLNLRFPSIGVVMIFCQFGGFISHVCDLLWYLILQLNLHESLNVSC